MTVIAQHTEPHPHTVLALLRTAEFSNDPEILGKLARSAVPGEVLRKIAHNPAASESTLAHLIEIDQRWLTYPVTRRRDASPAFIDSIIDSIARRLTDRNAIFHASSAPNATPGTLRYLASHPSAPAATRETVTRRLDAETSLTPWRSRRQE